MKSHLLTLAAAVLATFAFTACEKDPDYGDPAVNVNPGELNFKVDGGSETVNLIATVEWTVENSASWVKVEPMTGDPSKELQPVKVTVSKNEDIERTATVTFKQTDGTLTAKLTVNQEAFIPEVKTVDAATLTKMANIYKYQAFQLVGVVKSLKTDGSFNLVDNTGTLPVAGLSASEVAYGTQGGKLDNVKERDTITVIGYFEGGKLVYAYLVKVDNSYTEPEASSAATVEFPYEVNLTNENGGFVVRNEIFPYELDAIWTNSTVTGWKAEGINGNECIQTESWLFTAKVKLTNAKKPILVFEHSVANYESLAMAMAQTSVWISKDGGNFEQIPLSSYSYPDDLGATVWPSEDYSLDAYIGSTVQFAFKYVSDPAVSKDAGTWQIQKFSVKESEEKSQPDGSTGSEDYNKPGWDWNK